MTNTDDGSAEHAAHSSGDVRANSGGAFANLTHLTHLPHLTGKDSFGSELHPTSSNAPPEPATVDEPLIDSSAAAPTERNPVPTPPPSEPAPSLRPVEELQALCDAATCGPWFVVGQPWNSGPPYVISEHPDPHYGVFVADFDPVDWTNDNAAADAEFIAAARTALPSLLARLRAAEETLAAVGALAEETDAMPGLRRNFDGSISPGIVTTDKIRAALAEGASR